MTQRQNVEPENILIFLVGFMGAGKTTVGRALAGHLGFAFLDLDELISAHSGKSVSDIFAELGEAEFRRLESEAIRSCAEKVSSVIALGGGAYKQEQNRTLLRTLGKTVWLDCELGVCLRRIRGDGTRPLLGSDEEMRTLLAERRESYADADYEIATGDQTPGELAIRIAALLKL